MDRDLSRSLHKLTARLDRAADAMLRREAGVSYARFLALYMVGLEGADTQRALAERLTAAGAELVERWGGELEERFAALVESAQVPYRAYRTHTRRLLGALEGRA